MEQTQERESYVPPTSDDIEALFAAMDALSVRERRLLSYRNFWAWDAVKPGVSAATRNLATRSAHRQEADRRDTMYTLRDIYTIIGGIQ